MNRKKVLITGGSGLIGTHLRSHLRQKDWDVVHLTRSRNPESHQFWWDIGKKTIQEGALEGVTAIIHLAGANVGEKRWTKARKKEILTSRVKPTEVLLEYLRTHAHNVEVFISASGISYYGLSRQDIEFSESDPPGNDFLAEVAVAWEAALDGFNDLGIRTASVRTGVVLAQKGSALDKILVPIKLNLGAALGSGRQYFPWIHIDDLCALYALVLDQSSLNGPFNAVAPGAVTNAAFMKILATLIGKRIWLPNVPEWVMYLLVGEFARYTLEGNRISSEKIRSAGFTFQFSSIESALRDLLDR